MSEATEMFSGICGNCEGLDHAEITEADIREQAALSNLDGAGITEDDILLAIKGLGELLEEER